MEWKPGGDGRQGRWQLLNEVKAGGDRSEEMCKWRNGRQVVVAGDVVLDEF